MSRKDRVDWRHCCSSYERLKGCKTSSKLFSCKAWWWWWLLWGRKNDFICRGCGLSDGDGSGGLLLPVRDKVVDIHIRLLRELITDNRNKSLGQGLPSGKRWNIVRPQSESWSRSHSSLSSSWGGVNSRLCK